MAQRLQAQLERQLTLVERLGARDESAAELTELRTTLQRALRGAENLLVLGGAQHGPRTRGPRPLSSVLADARTAVEEPARVRLGAGADAAVAPRAGAALTALLSELLTYAVAASPSLTDVQVSSARTDDGGVTIEVATEQPVPPGSELDELNQRLAGHPIIDDIVAGRVGLFVAARLAARAGAVLRVDHRRGLLMVVRCPVGVIEPAAPAAPAWGTPVLDRRAGSSRLPGESREDVRVTGTGQWRLGGRPAADPERRPERTGGFRAARPQPTGGYRVPESAPERTGGFRAARGPETPERVGGTGSFRVPAERPAPAGPAYDPLFGDLPVPADDRDGGNPGGGELFGGTGNGVPDDAPRGRGMGGYAFIGGPRPSPRPAPAAPDAGRPEPGHADTGFAEPGYADPGYPDAAVPPSRAGVPGLPAPRLPLPRRRSDAPEPLPQRPSARPAPREEQAPAAALPSRRAPGARDPFDPGNAFGGGSSGDDPFAKPSPTPSTTGTYRTGPPPAPMEGTGSYRPAPRPTSTGSYRTGPPPTPVAGTGSYRPAPFGAPPQGTGSYSLAGPGTGSYPVPPEQPRPTPYSRSGPPAPHPSDDVLFGPLTDSQRDSMRDMGPTPIYEAVASAWFVDDPAEEGAPDWDTPSDAEWRAASERAARPEPQPASTAAGLPRRRPGTQMVAPPRYGSPAPASITSERAPDRVRQRLAVYQRGLERGRHRAGAEESQEQRRSS